MHRPKIPNKELYSLYNFCRQFSELMINPFEEIVNDEFEWWDYLIENYREHWQEILDYSNNPDYMVFTVINGNDGLVWKVDRGIRYVDREGYFILKIK